MLFSDNTNFRINRMSKRNGLGCSPHPSHVCSSYSCWFQLCHGFQTSVYEVKSLGDHTLEFGGERVGVGEVRWRGGKICKTLKFSTLPPYAPTAFEIIVQNLQRSNFFAIITQTSNIPHIQKHGWDGEIGREVLTLKEFNSSPNHLKLPNQLLFWVSTKLPLPAIKIK